MDEQTYWSPTWHATQWMMFHGLLDFVSSPPQRCGSNTKLEDRDTSKPHNHGVDCSLHALGSAVGMAIVGKECSELPGMLHIGDSYKEPAIYNIILHIQRTYL